MPHVARIGDSSNHGGTIISGSATDKANGIGIARVGDTHSCPYHGVSTIESTPQSSVYANGQLVATIGAVAGCGAVISSASPNVNIGGADPVVPPYTWDGQGGGSSGGGGGDGFVPPPGSYDVQENRLITSAQAYVSPLGYSRFMSPPNPSAINGTCLIRFNTVTIIARDGYGENSMYNGNTWMGWGYAIEYRFVLYDNTDTAIAVSEYGAWRTTWTSETGWSTAKVGVEQHDFTSFVPIPAGFDMNVDPRNQWVPNP